MPTTHSRHLSNCFFIFQTICFSSPLSPFSKHIILCSHSCDKESACQCKRRGFDPWVRKLPWRRKWQPPPIFLPGKSHGWRSLVGYSPWSREELDTTEQLHFHFSLSCTREGNANPLQYGCLENPRDRSLVGCRLWGHTESDMTDVT